MFIEGISIIKCVYEFYACIMLCGSVCEWNACFVCSFRTITFDRFVIRHNCPSANFDDNFVHAFHKPQRLYECTVN